ncbi:12025_t:CDS:1, partial [Racocetra fulgida]
YSIFNNLLSNSYHDSDDYDNSDYKPDDFDDNYISLKRRKENQRAIVKQLQVHQRELLL